MRGSNNGNTWMAAFLIGAVVGAVIITYMRPYLPEGFQTEGMTGPQKCTICGQVACPPVPDMSKYVLKSSIPPPKVCPDMKQYMLKTECPPTPDLSQYVLKSSIPKQEPVIIDNSACKKDAGECPPCPRPRCPEIKCPPPTVCPACPEAKCEPCPEPKVQCKAVDPPSSRVRPYLAPLNFGMFGGN
jgi:hypothetical protein